MKEKYYSANLKLVLLTALILMLSISAFAQRHRFPGDGARKELQQTAQTDQAKEQEKPKEKIWTPGSPEFRAVWITRFEWPDTDPEKCKQNITEIFETMKAANFNTAVFQIRGEAETLYPSEIEPWSPIIGGKDPGFDPLKLAIEEAHKRGIQFHAYINPMPMVSARSGTELKKTTPTHVFDLHGPQAEDSWVCRKKDGSLMDVKEAGYIYFAPGIPQVQEYLRKVIMDVVTRYDVDGIHLDRIRYPGPEYSYDKITKERFYGRGNPNLNDWQDFQREQINKLINDLYAQINEVKPKVVLSCAAWGIYNRHNIKGYQNFSSGYHDYYQDSWNWIKTGSMDILMPMIYWDMKDPKPDYNELLLDFVQNLGGEHIVGGQKTYKDDENIQEIDFSRKNDAIGTVLFAYRSAKNNYIFDNLKKSLYAEPAPIPELSWKKNPETGIILGKVVDENGKPVTDAWISLIPESKETKGEIYRQKWPSGSDGVFAFLKVPSGKVKIKAVYQNAGETESDFITIEAGKVSKAEIKIQGTESIKNQPFCILMSPSENAEITKENLHLLARTDPQNKVKINGEEIEVFGTGAFAKDNIPLQMGENIIKLEIVSADDSRKFEKDIKVIRKESEKKEKDVSGEKKPEIKEPSADISVLPGDVLEISAQGPSGMEAVARCLDGIEIKLTEKISEDGKGTGIYYANYKVPGTIEPCKPETIRLKLKEKDGGLFAKTFKVESKAKVELWDSSIIRIGETNDDGTAINFGTNSMRLGGPYFTEMPKGTRFEVIGAKGEFYKIKLTTTLSGMVTKKYVNILPENTEIPYEFFTSCSITGNEDCDYIVFPFKQKLVYALSEDTNGKNCIYMDLFNTHLAATWISHKSGAKITGPVTAEQIEDGWVRFTIPVNSKMLWGYWMEEKNGQHSLYIKRPPVIASSPDSPLKGLLIAVEPGHGGSGAGAIGFMNTKEKDINLSASEKLCQALEAKGARTMYARFRDDSPTLGERTKAAIDAGADMFISMHSNAAGTEGGYFRVSGTSTYYKHEQNYKAAKYVYEELLKLGWNEFGIVGNFNYSPLRMTNMPAFLVEQAFMSNPYDEARLLDEEYQKQQADAIVTGVERFLNEVRE